MHAIDIYMYMYLQLTWSNGRVLNYINIVRDGKRDSMLFFVMVKPSGNIYILGCIPSLPAAHYPPKIVTDRRHIVTFPNHILKLHHHDTKSGFLCLTIP